MAIAWLLEPRDLIPRSPLYEKMVVGDALVPAFGGLASMPEASSAPGLFKVFFFKSRIVGLSLITMDTRQIESRICARDLVFKCLRKSGRISCCESGKERAALWAFYFLGKNLLRLGALLVCP